MPIVGGLYRALYSFGSITDPTIFIDELFIITQIDPGTHGWLVTCMSQRGTTCNAYVTQKTLEEIMAPLAA